MFLGLILSWLVWRHVRKRLLRRLLLVITLAIAFGGGLLLVYTGSHLATDLLAGYLIGASAACCAIGLLAQTETRRNKRGGSCSRPGRRLCHSHSDDARRGSDEDASLCCAFCSVLSSV